MKTSLKFTDPDKQRLEWYRKARAKAYEDAKSGTPLIVANYEKAVEERRMFSGKKTREAA